MQETSDSALDFGHLARYTLGNRDLEIEILGLFSAQTAKTIAELESAADDRSWRVAAHTLKGSCRAVGAMQLARLAEAAECLSGPGDRGRVETLVAELRAASVVAQTAIDQRYGA